MNLYNGFNQLATLSRTNSSGPITTDGQQKIEIAFRGQSGVRVDALRIPSARVIIRCLGLWRYRQGPEHPKPAGRFDDAINAIDHDHRAGIRQRQSSGDHFAKSSARRYPPQQRVHQDIQQHLSAQLPRRQQDLLFRKPRRQLPAARTGNVASQNLRDQRPEPQRTHWMTGRPPHRAGRA